MMEAFKDWFLQKAPREQIFLGFLSVAVVLTIIYAGFLLPMAKERDAQLTNNRALLAQQIEVRKLAADVLGQKQAGSSQVVSLAQVANKTLREHGLTMEDYNPRGESGARVRLASVEYNKVMAWLDDLENRSGVQIKEVSSTADDVSGVLKTVSVTLHRN